MKNLKIIVLTLFITTTACAQKTETKTETAKPD